MSTNTTNAIAPGLVSVSFRSLSPTQIVALMVRTGLQGVEWGGDVHVPHGDVAAAREVAAMTRDAGLTVAAYGSYYRVGHSEVDGLSFAQVLDSASELGAPLIRVWAGVKGSAAVDAATRQQIEDDSRRIATAAAARGITVAFEYHANTLTDTEASAQALLVATAAAGMRSYWQPTSGLDVEQQCSSLRAMLPYLTNLHVYQWRAGARLPLADGTTPWARFLSLSLQGAPWPRRWALLEFVRDDSPEQLVADAATLRQWLTELNKQG